MKCELVGIPNTVKRKELSDERFFQDKNRIVMEGTAHVSGGLLGCYGDFQIPISEQFYNALRCKGNAVIPKIKITIETIE